MIRSVMQALFVVLSCVWLTGCLQAVCCSADDGGGWPEEYDRTGELETAAVSLHESDLRGDPLYVIFGIDAIHGDDLSIQDRLLEGISNSLSDAWVKADKIGAKDNLELRETIERALRQTTDGTFLGAQKVNYILNGRLESSSLKMEYDKPSFLCTSIKDNCLGTCEYQASARLSLEAERLPEKRRTKKWVLKTSESDSRAVQGNCSDVGSTESQQVINKLVNEITQKILECSKPALEDYFSSRGYLTHYYSDGERFWFAMSGGNAAGFKRGDTLMIERYERFGADDNYGAYRTLAEGKIKQVYEKHSLFAVKSQDIANSLKIHDRARLVRERYIPSLKCPFILAD